MFCTTCIAAKRAAKGSSVPHYCDACGFPLVATGQSIRKSEAAFLVATADIYAEHNHGSRDVRHALEPWRADPLLVALAAIRRI